MPVELDDQGTDQEIEQDQIADSAVEATPADEATESADEQSSGGGVSGADVVTSIDEGLASIARSYGLDTANFKDNDSLGAAVANFDRQLAEFGRNLGQRGAPQGEQKTAQQQQAEQAAGLNLDELLPDAEFDPKLRDAFKKQNEFWQQQLAAERKANEQKMAEKFGTLDQFVERQAREESIRYSQRLDDYFSKQTEWEGTFGKGAVNTLSAFSPQLKARNELVQEAMALGRADSELGRPQQALEQLLERAKRAKFSQQQDTIARKQVATELNKRGNAALSRPAAKQGRPNPTQAVTKFVKDWDRKHLGEG